MAPAAPAPPNAAPPGVAVIAAVSEFQGRWHADLPHAAADGERLAQLFRTLRYGAVIDIAAGCKWTLQPNGVYQQAPTGGAGCSWALIEQRMLEAMMGPAGTPLGAPFGGPVVLYLISRGAPPARTGAGQPAVGACMYHEGEVVTLDRVVSDLGAWAARCGRPSGAPSVAICDLIVDAQPQGQPQLRAHAAPGVGLLASQTPERCAVFSPKLVDNVSEILLQGRRGGAAEWPLTLLTIQLSFLDGDGGWAAHLMRPSLDAVRRDSIAALDPPEAQRIWDPTAEWGLLLYAADLSDAALVAPLAHCDRFDPGAELQTVVVAVDHPVRGALGTLRQTLAFLREPGGLPSLGMPPPDQLQPIQCVLDAAYSATYRQAWEHFRAAYGLCTSELQHVDERPDSSRPGCMRVYFSFGMHFPDGRRDASDDCFGVASMRSAPNGHPEWDRLENAYVQAAAAGAPFYFGTDPVAGSSKQESGAHRRAEGCRVTALCLRLEGVCCVSPQCRARVTAESRAGAASALCHTLGGGLYRVSLTPLSIPTLAEHITGVRYQMDCVYNTRQSARVAVANQMDVSRARRSAEAGAAVADTSGLAALCSWLDIPVHTAIESAVRIQSVQRMVAVRRQFRAQLWQLGKQRHLSPLWHRWQRPLGGREMRTQLRRWLLACSHLLPWRVLGPRVVCLVETGCDCPAEPPSSGVNSVPDQLHRWHDRRCRALGRDTTTGQRIPGTGLAERCAELLTQQLRERTPGWRGTVVVRADGAAGRPGSSHIAVGLRVQSEHAYGGDAVPPSVREHLHSVSLQLAAVAEGQGIAAELSISEVIHPGPFRPPRSAALALRAALGARKRPWREERWPGELPCVELPAAAVNALTPAATGWDGWAEILPPDGRVAVPVYPADADGRPEGAEQTRDGAWHIAAEASAFLPRGKRVMELPTPDGCGVFFDEYWVRVRWQGRRAEGQSAPELHTGYVRRSDLVSCAVLALRSVLCGGERKLRFNDAAPGQTVFLVPPDLPAAEAPRRYSAVVSFVNRQQGIATLVWAEAADGGPPPALAPPAQVLSDWWDGGADAVLGLAPALGAGLRLRSRLPDRPAEPRCVGYVRHLLPDGGVEADFGPGVGRRQLAAADLPRYQLLSDIDFGDGGGALRRALERPLLPGVAVCTADRNHTAFGATTHGPAAAGVRAQFCHLLEVSDVVACAERQSRKRPAEELPGVRQLEQTPWIYLSRYWADEGYHDGLYELGELEEAQRIAMMNPTVRALRERNAKYGIGVFCDSWAISQRYLGCCCTYAAFTACVLLTFLTAYGIFNVPRWVSNMLALVYLNDMTQLSRSTLVTWVLTYLMALLVVLFLTAGVVGMVRARLSHSLNNALLYVCAKYSRLLRAEMVAGMRTEDMRRLIELLFVTVPQTLVCIFIILASLVALLATSLQLGLITVVYLVLRQALLVCYDQFVTRHMAALRNLETEEQLNWVVLRGPSGCAGHIVPQQADDHQMRICMYTRSKKTLNTDSLFAHVVVVTVDWFFLLMLLPFYFYVGAWQVAREPDDRAQMAQMPEEIPYSFFYFFAAVLALKWFNRCGYNLVAHRASVGRVLTLLTHCPLSEAEESEVAELLDIAKDDERLRQHLEVGLPLSRSQSGPPTMAGQAAARVTARYAPTLTGSKLLLHVDWLDELQALYPASPVLLYISSVVWVAFIAALLGFMLQSWESECATIYARCGLLDGNVTLPRPVAMPQHGSYFGRCSLLHPVAYSLRLCARELLRSGTVSAGDYFTPMLEYNTWQSGRVGFSKRFRWQEARRDACPTDGDSSQWVHFRNVESGELTRNRPLEDMFSESACYGTWTPWDLLHDMITAVRRSLVGQDPVQDVSDA
eukprot:TRINITY_DN65076_c0_g1_i1.p1 TRINITY_DN65076_c0_g1~~TRINITY_DN65076_c0_g1_i1.p1  ORF type:complete len:1885 (+),score=567.70 TRINITY_DN65076_c0_g1_i1:81-5657(+)